VKLANDLDSKGLYREADTLDFVIKKISMALVEMYGGSDVGVLGRPDYNPNSSVEPDDGTVYNPFMPGGHHFQEWYDSIQKLAPDVIYIHVDYKKILNDEGLLNKFKDLFPVMDSSEDALERAKKNGSPVPIFGSFPKCDAKKFFEEFPIPELMREYGSRLNEIIFVVADTVNFRDESRGESLFADPKELDLETLIKRDPYTAAHDFGHLGADLNESQWREIITNVFQQYFKKLYNPPLEPIMTSFFIKTVFKEIIKSTERDIHPDIFAYIVGGGSLEKFFIEKYKDGPPVIEYNKKIYTPIGTMEEFKNAFKVMDLTLQAQATKRNLIKLPYVQKLMTNTDPNSYGSRSPLGETFRRVYEQNQETGYKWLGLSDAGYARYGPQDLSPNEEYLSGDKGKVVLFI
jgi:hypothetical protein